MIYRLMERFNIDSVEYVINVGDTVADILEGQNAGTLYQVAVLSGSDSIEQLDKMKPNLIVNSVKDLLNNKYF
jgi:phosphoglycolate phosphatase-like HAD superfamily hydrolase